MLNSRPSLPFRRRRSAGLLACAPLLLGLAASTVRAGSPTLTGGTDGGFTRKPLTLTLDTRFGYDDNTLDEPRDKHDSAFINTSLNVAYQGGNSRTQLSVGATSGHTFYFDRPGREYDPNLGLSVALTYKLAPRASLILSSNSVYQAEPDFGVVGIQERRNSDYFYTANSFALNYRWTGRFSTVTSYNPSFYVYRLEPYSFFQDRVEHYFAQSFRFLVQPRLTMVGEYRFGYIDYFNDRNASISNRTFNLNGAPVTAPVFVPDFHSNSFNHFALVGFDYTLGPRFRAGLRVGAQFRYYDDDETFVLSNPGFGVRLNRTDTGSVVLANSRVVSLTRGSEVSPYVEGTLTYDLNRRGNIALVTRYGIEEGDLAVSNSSRNSYRIGATYNQGITARLGGYLGFSYTHNSYDNADENNNFDDNVYDVSLGLRYVLNRHVALEVGYTHTSVESEFNPRQVFNNGAVNNVNGFNGREYDRNRYFAGARFAF